MPQGHSRQSRPKWTFVDSGYHGYGFMTTAACIACQKLGLTPALRRDLRRCTAIEPAICPMKTDGGLARCAFKDTLGDALYGDLCGSGHNIRMILAHPRAVVAAILAALLAMVGVSGDSASSKSGLRARVA